MSGTIDGLLDPTSIAVVGASEAPGNRGGTAIRLLHKFGYRGSLAVVHPSGRPVDGVPAVPSVEALDDVPDVVLVAVRAELVPEVLRAAGERGVRRAVVWAGGFAEAGRDGARLQGELRRIASAHGVRVLGPNCLGVVNTWSGYCGTFATWLRGVPNLLPGHVSLVTQSGGLGSTAHAMAQRAGIGFRYFVSTGNEMDVGCVEVLEAFADDPETHVVTCYVEGVSDGRRLLRALEAARDNGKEVVLLKAGRSPASVRAAAAHTGALAGEARVWDALLDERGVLQVRSVDELVEAVTFLECNWHKPRTGGDRIAILGYGGGAGVLAADQCTAAGLRVEPLPAGVTDTLASLLPEIASTGNPVDMTPEAANQDRFRKQLPAVLDAVDGAAPVDALLLQGGALGDAGPAIAGEMATFVRRSRKGVAVYWHTPPAAVEEVFRAAGIPVFSRQREAAGCLALLARRGARARRQPVDEEAGVRPASIPTVGETGIYGEHVVHELLSAGGVGTLAGGLARTDDEAVAVARGLPGPVAMKVVSDITHRAAAGLVALSVAGDDVGREFDRLVASAQAQGAAVEGVYVQQMARPGHELIVSAFRDPAFGVVVTCGAGGVLAELLDDVTFSLAPLDPATASEIVGRLRISRHLERTAADFRPEPLAHYLARFSRLAADLPYERFVVELNPVIATRDAAVAADGLLVVEALGR